MTGATCKKLNDAIETNNIWQGRISDSTNKKEYKEKYLDSFKLPIVTFEIANWSLFHSGCFISHEDLFRIMCSNKLCINNVTYALQVTNNNANKKKLTANIGTLDFSFDSISLTQHPDKSVNLINLLINDRDKIIFENETNKEELDLTKFKFVKSIPNSEKSFYITANITPFILERLNYQLTNYFTQITLVIGVQTKILNI